MATRTVAINTEAHVATIGDTEIKFQPEAIGAAFAEAYSGLKDAQKRVAAAGDSIAGDDLSAITEAMRGFLTRLMLPDSAKVFAKMQLPNRVLVQLIEWTAEIYGGGSGNQAAPGGPASGS